MQVLLEMKQNAALGRATPNAGTPKVSLPKVSVEGERETYGGLIGGIGSAYGPVVRGATASPGQPGR
jgi:hypothetical protein